ncbi:hypothetical protein B0H63DRAFT_471090 [Podospora didyma]|uniref:Nicotinamide-nucleotide adenylyltransferase n=1 Tax=Podospora didyma TaxID=330526 RepID=A0AAE0NUC0_9PEZI|nr:hypothetical protein B0H63DRAFT_471090 [Podospora didyma]
MTLPGTLAVEPTMQRNSIFPAGVSSRSLVDVFSRALTSFQSAGTKFQVVCTIPPSRRPSQQLLNPIPPRTKPSTLVVLDSSFNPPTRAHLRMATSALHDLAKGKKDLGTGTLRLLLLLAVNNADKAPKPASFDQRLAMMWAFAEDIQNTLHSGQQKDQEGEAPSIDVALSTQPYFHEKCAAIAESDFYRTSDNSEGDMEQVVLAGFDTLIRILNPKYYNPPGSVVQVSVGEKTPMQKVLDPFFARARLRITMRTDDDWGGKEEQLAYLEDLLRGDGLQRIGGSGEWGSRIEIIEGRQDGENIVSSTYARAAAKEQDWSGLDIMVTPGVRWWIEHERLYSEH